MSGNVTINEGRTAILLLFIRVMLAGSILFLHSPIGQLMSLWQASQIISPGAFPDSVLLQNAAVPMVFFIGAVMLTIGFKTKFTAVALLLLAFASVLNLLFIGSPGNALDWLPRIAFIFGLLVPAKFGAGRWSIDGLMEPRLAPRAVQ